jgi:hypothetical protein
MASRYRALFIFIAMIERRGATDARWAHVPDSALSSDQDERFNLIDFRRYHERIVDCEGLFPGITRLILLSASCATVFNTVNVVSRRIARCLNFGSEVLSAFMIAAVWQDAARFFQPIQIGHSSIIQLTHGATSPCDWILSASFARVTGVI